MAATKKAIVSKKTTSKLSETSKSFVEEPRHDWNSEKEVAEFLASLIKMTKAKTFLEIGTFQGYTTVEIAKALPKDSYLVTIDIKDYITPDNNSELAKQSKQGKVIEFILEDSIYALPKLKDGHFDVILIDSMHTFEHVIKEFKQCERLLAKGGTICMHDSIHIEDVAQIVAYAKHYGWNAINLNTTENRGLALLTRNY
jgi:predicted O-methyltransferase YrrM